METRGSGEKRGVPSVGARTRRSRRSWGVSGRRPSAWLLQPESGDGWRSDEGLVKGAIR
jgi:hypothetical protein